MVNLQEYVNRRNPVTSYSPTRVLDRPRANAGTAGRILNQRAAPPQYQQRTPSFQMGQAPQQPQMPDTSMGGGLLDTALAEARAGVTAPQPEGGGGFGGFLGSVVNSAPGRFAMSALNVLDTPRRAVISGVQEAADVFNGGDASWDDFVSQVHEGIGFGDVLGSTGNIWLDRGLGFLGDVALDPLTYVLGAGTLGHFAGREARAGLAARALEAGLGRDVAERVGKIGLHALDNSQRELLNVAQRELGGIFAEGADKIKDAGYYFRFPFTERPFKIPVTGALDRTIGGSVARVRGQVAQSGLGGWLRHRNADQVMVDALDRLIGGRGPLSLEAAGEAYNFYQAFRVGMNMSKRESDAAIGQIMRESGGIEALRGLVDTAEREGGTAINGYFDRMAKVLEDMGINHGRVKPGPEGGIHYVPHYYTPEGKVWLGKETDQSKAMSAIFGAGHSLEDYSPSLMKRHFVGRSEPYKIMGHDFHIPTGTIAEINAEFRRVTGEQFDLLETDFVKIAGRYAGGVGEGVGNMTAIQRLLKSKGGMLRSAEDQEILRAVVDDAETKLATSKKITELEENLNQIGADLTKVHEQLATGLHNVSADVLTPRLQGVIEELTSLSEDQRFRMLHALERDHEITRITGGAARRGAEVEPYGELKLALEEVRSRALVEINRLAGERVQLQHVAQMQRAQLLEELARSPGKIFDAPRTFNELRRYQQASQQLAELVRDASAVDSMHGMLVDATIKADAARALADNDSFLSQFVPGPDGLPTAPERVVVGMEPAYSDPRMSSQAIFERANTDRQRLLADDSKVMPPGVNPNAGGSTFVIARDKARTKAAEISAQSQRVADARLHLEKMSQDTAPTLQAAHRRVEAEETRVAALRAEYRELRGVPGRRSDRWHLRARIRELEHGSLATAKADYDQLRKPLTEARTAWEQQTQQLTNKQAELLELTREMDTELWVAGARREPGLQISGEPNELPSLPMTPEEHARAKALHDSDVRAQQVADRDGRIRAARRARAADTKELERVSDELDIHTNPSDRPLLDANGNKIIMNGEIAMRRAGLASPGEERRAAQMALARDDAQRQFDNFEAQLEAHYAELRMNDVDGTLTPSERNALEDTIRQTEERLEAAASRRDELDSRLSRYSTASERAKVLAERKRVLEKRIRRANSITERAKPGYRMRQLRIAAIEEDLAHYDIKLGERRAVEAANDVRATAAMAQAEAARTDILSEHWFEAEARRIQQREAREMQRRATLVGYTPEWREVPPIDVEGLGLRVLSPDERLQWEHARSIIDQAESFPGSWDNEVVRSARERIKELRPKIGYAEEDYAFTATNYSDLREAMEEINLSRNAFEPDEGVLKAIDAPMTEAQYRATIGRKGGDTSMVKRGQRSYRLARWVERNLVPKLTERKAIGPASELLGRADVAAHYQQLVRTLEYALDQRGTRATMFSVAAIEKASSDLNELSEIMLRYNRAIEMGLEPSAQLGAFISERVLKRESDELARLISNDAKKLERRAVSRGQAKARAQLAGRGEEIPEHLLGSQLSAEESRELRHIAKESNYKAIIKRDQELVEGFDARKTTIPLTSEEKRLRSLALNRIRANSRRLLLHQAKPVRTGMLNDVIEDVTDQLEQAVMTLDYTVGELNDVRRTMGSPTRVAEHLSAAKIQHASLQGSIDSAEAGNRRLGAAVRRAESRGDAVVRYRPERSDDFFMTIEQARAALASGEVPEHMVPRVEAAILKASKARRMPTGPVMVTKVNEKETLRARIEQLMNRLTPTKVRSKKPLTDVERAELRTAQERLAKIEAFEARFPDAVEEVDSTTGLRKLRSRRSIKRDEAETELTRFAAEQGVSPRDVISSKVFRMEGPKGMSVLTLEEARAMHAANTKAIEGLRGSVDGYARQIRVLDGSIHDDISNLRAIIEDQQALPNAEDLQRQIDEINNRRAVTDHAAATGNTSFADLDPEQIGLPPNSDVITPQRTPEQAAEVEQEARTIATLQARLEAVRRYGQMPPEQLAEFNQRLEEMLSDVEKYRNQIGDHYDMASAAIDNGERYFEDLVMGRRNPTARDLELMRSLLGAESGDYAASMLRKINEHLGIEYTATRKDLDFLGAKLSMPPVTGGSRSLLLSSYDPSPEDLRNLWEDLRDIPAALLDEKKALQREQWMSGIDELLNPKVGEQAARKLNPAEVKALFTELEVHFKGSKILDTMRRRVHEAADLGEIITDTELRGTLGQALVAAAKVNMNDNIQSVMDMLTYLGISFSTNVPGFTGKMQALGYSLAHRDLDPAKLRRFIESRMTEIGLPVDANLTHLQSQRQIRLTRLRSMRLGLGGEVRSLPGDYDPRQLFEEIGRTGEHTVDRVETELAAFKDLNIQTGARDDLAEIIAEREAKLTAQIDEARAKGDTALVGELTEMRDGLDGRRLVDPEDEPMLTGESAPQPTGMPSYEQQIGEAETAVTDARAQRDAAAKALAAAREQSSGGANPAALRNPETPEGYLSLSEIIAENQRLASLEGTVPPDELRQMISDWEVEVGKKRWRGEPEESKAAAREALSGEGNNNSLEVAQNQLNQAELNLSQEESRLVRLRNEGAPAATEAETPATSLGDVDQRLRQTDPDEAMTFDDANAEYENKLAEVDSLDNDPDVPDWEQQRAQAAARARKMATKRAELWPARKAELEAERNQIMLEHLGSATMYDRPDIAPNAVTWGWTHVITTGQTNPRSIRRSIGTIEQGSTGAGRRASRVVADVTGLPARTGGAYQRENLPAVAERISKRLSPAEEVRQSMLDAAEAGDAERARLETLLDAYEGRNVQAELAAAQQERDEAAAALRAQKPDLAAENRARIQGEIDANSPEAVAEQQRMVDLRMRTEEARIRRAELDYNDQLAGANAELAETRSRILNYRTAGEEYGNEAAQMRKILDYQGISREDLESHLDDLRALNRQRATITDLADDNDLAMVETLLNESARQAAEMRALEGQSVDFTKQIADFKSGARSVEPVIDHVLVDGWRPMFKELAQGSDAVVLANDLATALINISAGLRKPETWGIIDDYTRFFKTYATATPGFHVRNLLSGVFMNLVDNVRLREMRRAMSVWRDFERNPIGFMDSLPADSEVRRALMVVFGSGAAGVFKEVGGQSIEGLIGTKAGKRLMDNALTRWNQRMGSRVEGSLRLAMALDSMTKGHGIAQALERVTRYHFDYTRLSSFDRQARRLIPFWTFMSRNLPLQVESMWLRPRTYLQYQSFVRNFGEAADPLTPEYWLRQGAFTMDTDAEGTNSPWYLAPDLPHLRVGETIDQLAQGNIGQAIGSNINPLVMAPAEAFGFHRKVYTGQDINQEYNEPTAAMKGLMPLFALLGGTETGGTSGHRLLDDRYAHVARSLLPTLNLIERLTDNSGVREGRTDETALRALGAPVYQLTDKLRQSTRRSNYYDRRDERRSQADLARK